MAAESEGFSLSNDTGETTDAIRSNRAAVKRLMAAGIWTRDVVVSGSFDSTFV